MDVKIVSADDWAALYVDEILIYENHSISGFEVAQFVPGFEHFNVTSKYNEKITNDGGFPKNFSDIGNKNLTK